MAQSDVQLKAALGARARAEGFSAIGIARPDGIPEAAARLARFLNEGRQGDMAWMADRAAWRGDPTALWPEARSAVLAALALPMGIRGYEELKMRRIAEYHDAAAARAEARATTAS